MIKYKSTLLNGLTVETVSPNMTEAVTHVEKWYSTYIVKCEIKLLSAVESTILFRKTGKTSLIQY